MCGRFAFLKNLTLLQEELEFLNLAESFTRKEVFLPTDLILTISKNRKTNQKELTPKRWGLIPNFVRDFDSIKKYSLFNARSESLEEKKSFQNLLDSNRCIIPADAFFEFKSEGKQKDQYKFSLASETSFWMAGLWDEWIHPQTKENIFSCTILTTEANEIVKPIHEKNRMPVILDKEYLEEWMNSNTPFFKLKELLKPYTSEKMKFEKTVQIKTPEKSITKIENNQPSLFGS